MSKRSSAVQVASLPANEANDTPVEVDAFLAVLPRITLEQLTLIMQATSAESKRRREEALAARPQPGSRIEVIGGKFKGHKGTLMRLGKSRCHANLDDMPITAYLQLQDVKPLAG